MEKNKTIKIKKKYVFWAIAIILIGIIIIINIDKIKIQNKNSKEFNNVINQNNFTNNISIENKSKEIINKTTCINECSWGSKCNINAFYYCFDSNNDGCNEWTLIDYCGLDYTCGKENHNLNVCLSPTKTTIFEIRNKGSLQDQIKDYKKITTNTTYLRNLFDNEQNYLKNYNCKVLKDIGDFVIGSCKENE